MVGEAGIGSAAIGRSPNISPHAHWELLSVKYRRCVLAGTGPRGAGARRPQRRGNIRSRGREGAGLRRMSSGQDRERSGRRTSVWIAEGNCVPLADQDPEVGQRPPLARNGYPRSARTTRPSYQASPNRHLLLPPKSRGQHRNGPARSTAPADRCMVDTQHQPKATPTTPTHVTTLCAGAHEWVRLHPTVRRRHPDTHFIFLTR